MKLYEFGTIIIIVVVSAVALVAGLVSIPYLGKDNPVEQVAEEVIKLETGQTVDLSPQQEVPK